MSDAMTFNQEAVASPDLILLLFREYEVYLEHAYLSRKDDDPGARRDTRKALESASHFAKFARDYLSQHRPRAMSYGDSNYDLMLSNGKRVSVSPPEQGIRGTMAPVAGRTVDPTPGRVLPDVYANQGAVPISGNAKGERGAVNYADMNQKAYESAMRQGRAGVDKTMPRPAVEYNPEHGKKYADDLLNR